MKVLISLSSVVTLGAFKASLAKLCASYHPSIPLIRIGAIAFTQGIKLIDEDGSDWEGFLTGRDGRCSIELADLSGHPLKKYLHLQWHKMPSGKYEINAYTD